MKYTDEWDFDQDFEEFDSEEEFVRHPEKDRVSNEEIEWLFKDMVDELLNKLPKRYSLSKVSEPFFIQINTAASHVFMITLQGSDLIIYIETPLSGKRISRFNQMDISINLSEIIRTLNNTKTDFNSILKHTIEDLIYDIFTYEDAFILFCEQESREFTVEPYFTMSDTKAIVSLINGDIRILNEYHIVNKKNVFQNSLLETNNNIFDIIKFIGIVTADNDLKEYIDQTYPILIKLFNKDYSISEMKLILERMDFYNIFSLLSEQYYKEAIKRIDEFIKDTLLSDSEIMSIAYKVREDLQQEIFYSYYEKTHNIKFLPKKIKDTFLF